MAHQDPFLEEPSFIWAAGKVLEPEEDGYQVLKTWLSYREKKMLGRGLKIAEVQHMARRIAALLLLSP